MQRAAIRLLPAFAAAFAVVEFAPSAVAAEKKKATPILAPAPPPAMPRNVRVTRGKKVDIPLRTFGRHNEQLSYVIKSRPAHGRLSEPRVIDREASMVTYEPPADFAVKNDRFLFSVKTSLGVSAPVEVNIAIVDEAPVLSIPAALDFGTILAGVSMAKEFELANRGGGLSEGELKVPAPWRVEGNSRYQLAAGESASFKIVFAPAEAGTFRGEIVFTSDREHSTALDGTAAMPVSVEPAEILLRHEPGFALRTGVFEIINRTGEARTFRLSAGQRLRVEPQASVPAGGRLAVAISTQAADVAALDDAVKVDADGFALRVPVKAAAVGAILRGGQERVTLGRLPAARGGQVALDVENIGGTAAVITGEIGAPFLVTPASFLLGAGEKRQIAVGIQPADAGPYRGWLKLKAAPMVIEVEIEAELAAGKSESPRVVTTSARTSRPEPSERSVRASETTATTRSSLPWIPTPKLRDVRVSEVLSTSARIDWPAAISDATNFRAERRVLSLEAGKDRKRDLRVDWATLPKAAFAREGPRWVARLTGLQPAQLHAVRVVPINASGEAGAPLFAVDVFTPEARPFLRRPSITQALLGVFAICLGVLAWKRWKKV